MRLQCRSPIGIHPSPLSVSHSALCCGSFPGSCSQPPAIRKVPVHLKGSAELRKGRSCEGHLVRIQSSVSSARGPTEAWQCSSCLESPFLNQPNRSYARGRYSPSQRRAPEVGLWEVIAIVSRLTGSTETNPLTPRGYTSPN